MYICSVICEEDRRKCHLSCDEIALDNKREKGAQISWTSVRARSAP